MIHIAPTVEIDEREIRLTFIRSSGPGGQNVNKVATAVQLRFNVAGASSLPAEVRSRLIRLAGRRMSADGVLIINARRFRSQELNRQDAIARLVELVRKATEKPKSRHRTKPSSSSIKRRLDNKGHRSRLKRLRRFASHSGED